MIDVVVVDDDFMVRSIHEEFVGMIDGFRVVGTAGTGADALKLIAEVEPGLVLLDVHLPDMSGIDVLYELRRERNPVGVIIVTAERDADYVRSALRGGASQYLIKPFEVHDLQSRMEQFRVSMDKVGQGPADQVSVDAAFRSTQGDAVRPALPKGLSSRSLEIVEAALREGGELSAADWAPLTGMSRVSVRRYLEHLVLLDRAQVRPQYGGGRPVHLYSWKGNP